MCVQGADPLLSAPRARWLPDPQAAGSREGGLRGRGLGPAAEAWREVGRLGVGRGGGSNRWQVLTWPEPV